MDVDIRSTKELLVDGERQLGRYTVVIVRYVGNETWTPDVMQLDGTITNYRLILRPFKKRYQPAHLPSHYFASIELATKGRNHCVELNMSTGHTLYIKQATGKLEDLYDDLCAMKSRPPKFAFDDSVARRDIERLITFFDKLPMPDTLESSD